MKLKTSHNGQSSIDAFKEWIDSVRDEELAMMIYRGKLNRRLIAIECGFAKSVLKQNPTVKQLLHEFENTLIAKGILKGSNVTTSKSQNDEIITKTYQKQDKRIAELEQRIFELEAKIKRYECMDQAVQWAIRQ